MRQHLNLGPLITLCGITHVRIVLPDVLVYWFVSVLPEPCAIMVFGIQLVR